MKNNLGSQKTCQGQAETVHAEVSFYNTPQYLRYHLMKSKCLRLAQLKLQYERGVECSVENNQKGGRSGKTHPRFQQSGTGGLFRKRKRPIGDHQIDLGLAQDRTYKVSKKKWYRAAKQTSCAAKTCCTQ